MSFAHKDLVGLTVLVLLIGCFACNREIKPPAPQDGLALAIVYDTSGSMADDVINASGAKEPKYRIARRAINSILDLMDVYTKETTNGMPRVVYAELIALNKSQVKRVLQLSPFNAQALKTTIDRFPKPTGGTPLGKALLAAAEDLMASPLNRKHILVLTDGENTEGRRPEAVMPELLEQARTNNTGIQIHFVAFDVAADIFEPVKTLGATVVSAHDETQLNEQLEFILQKKILLENEEPSLNK